MTEQAWPSPIKSEGEVGNALREYRARTESAGNEGAAYGRLTERLVRRPRRLRWVMAAGAALALLAVAWNVRVRSRNTVVAKIAQVPAPATSSALPPIDIGKAPTRLPAGTSLLTSHVTAMLDQDAVAHARFEEGTLDIALERGRIELHVPPREIGQAVLVTANRFRFTVVGTVFSLVLDEERLALNVSEGLVAVSREADHLAAVVAGEHWATALPAEPAHVAPRIARRPLRKECADAKDRLGCYREKAKKSGPEGERAQHTLARYLRDNEVDLTAALAEFEAQRARFPRGELRTDADRAIIDLLPRLGRHAEALVETQSFLDAQPDAQDRAEIRLLRGDIYRAIYRDLMSAEREYDEGAVADGRAGDDSRFLRALCLEALGRVDEARVAYADYLAQAGMAHEREVRKRMEKLAR